MNKYEYMNYNEILGLFKTGREFLDWVKGGEWIGQLWNGSDEIYFQYIRQAINPFSYETPIPDEEMCAALERTLRTGEMIDFEPDEEFLPGGEKHGQCDGWTYHVVFKKPESPFFVPTPSEPPEASRKPMNPNNHWKKLEAETQKQFDKGMEELKAIHKELMDEIHSKYSDAEIRIAEYSHRMKSVQEAVEEGWVALDALQSQIDSIGKLDKYYAEEWKSDFEADEKGEINKDIDRSVLGEDTLYNLLEDFYELRDSLREFVDSIRYPSDDNKEEGQTAN